MSHDLKNGASQRSDRDDGQQRELELLRKVLREAQPRWTARLLLAVESKLAQVGVGNCAALAASLGLTEGFPEGSRENHDNLYETQLNEQLRQAGHKTFSADTLDALCLALQTNYFVGQAGDSTGFGEQLERQASTDSSTDEMQASQRFSDLEGVWLLQDSNDVSFEIRAKKSSRSPGVEMENAPLTHELWYFQHLGSGKVCQGLLEQRDASWPWIAALSPSGLDCLEIPEDDVRYDRIRLLRDGTGPQASLVWSRRSAGTSHWEDPIAAHRPRVYAFYNANDHPGKHRYAHVHGSQTRFPLVGLTSGWLPATVLERSSNKTKVRFSPSFCDPFDLSAMGQSPSRAPRSPLPERVVLRYVSAPTQRTMGKGKGKFGKVGKTPGLFFGKTKPAHSFSAPAEIPIYSPTEVWCNGKGRPRPTTNSQRTLDLHIDNHLICDGSKLPRRPLLSILCFRYFDYWTDGKWSDYSVLSDGMLVDVLDGPCSVHRELPGEYEIFTVFIRETSDLRSLDPGQLRAMLTGENVVAWYFLWPTPCGNTNPWGYVSEEDLFPFMHAMERVPVRTGWPHMSHLYRQLAGKLWVPQMCLHKEYRVPPTTRIYFADFEYNNRRAVIQALDVIMRLRKNLWNREPVPYDRFKGVVKLGFSWGGLDVLPFKGIASMMKNVKTLFSHPECRNTACLVQEMVADVVAEHRVLCFYDKVAQRFHKEPLWSIIGKPAQHAKHKVNAFDVDEFQCAFGITLSRQKVASELFQGDYLACRKVEEEASRLVDRWLLWFQTESPEPPQCTRIDFLITRSPDQGGAASVWTCEVGECGASLCSVEVHPRNIVALNNAILQDCSGRFPKPLPVVLPRNDGWKS